MTSGFAPSDRSVGRPTSGLHNLTAFGFAHRASARSRAERALGRLPWARVGGRAWAGARGRARVGGRAWAGARGRARPRARRHCPNRANQRCHGLGFPKPAGAW
ncbi:hypothetical protein BH772_gp021 [Gordonia phage Bachita]|uniref:Uncharacterized protein n=1 Tax=Gordonia phage Bachita TaxID=1838061 RepID=A0A160DFQ9_9CAUD|nr:hypothetical protein BH772_gp021 [Gordonia phage Bachita]ANA86866.1 hypothetical protein PBI_BACHITA_190 [Gordonia phage Bachita]